MTSTPDFVPPPVAAVPAGIHRPLWSVMIPTYNCARYLRQTLESVLAQDPGPEQMQIEVVDDCSTKDDPEAVVREIGRGRVTFHRKPANAGATANFNTCIERSRAQLVHILHGDDYVLPGFYQAIGRLVEGHPNAALYATRSFIVDEDGIINSLTERLQALEGAGRDASRFFYFNPLQFASVVVRRGFWEEHGGFIMALVHTADCEMWSRAIASAGGVVSPEVLACYRQFSANDTGRLMRTAENLRDIDRLNHLFARRHPAFDLKTAQAHQLARALQMATQYEAKNDHEAAQASWAYWKQNASLKLRLKRALGIVKRKLL